MSLAQFQQALVDLTLAPRLASRLLRGDETVLRPYRLTEGEARRLRDLVTQPGMAVSCSLSRGNRFEPVGEIFPMTCVLLEPVLRDLLDELWRDVRPANYQFSGEEEAFAEIVRRKITSGELSIEYLDEIFDYECACWSLAQQMRTQTDPDRSVETFVDFHHPPELLLPPLSQLTRPPAGLPTGLYRSRLTLRGTRFDVQPLSLA